MYFKPVNVFILNVSQEPHSPLNIQYNQTPRSDYFPWQYIIANIKVATRDVIAVRRLTV